MLRAQRDLRDRYEEALGAAAIGVEGVLSQIAAVLSISVGSMAIRPARRRVGRSSWPSWPRRTRSEARRRQASEAVGLYLG